MDQIYQSAKVFEKLFAIEYDLKLSCNKKLVEFRLDFRKEDFFHLVGLQYLEDLDISKNPSNVFDNILNKNITDESLSNSNFYLFVDENYVVVKERISGFQFIEDCLDSKSIVFKYIKNKNAYSRIRAEFMIEVIVNSITYYVFFIKRNTDNNYRLCSFFEKKSEYKGNKAYWLYKEKIDTNAKTANVLYNRLKF